VDLKGGKTLSNSTERLVGAADVTLPDASISATRPTSPRPA